MRNTSNWKKQNVECFSCKKIFSQFIWRKAKYCSLKCSSAIPWNKGNGKSLKRGYIIINDNWKPEHRSLVEGKIGRLLKKSEVIHHWDENKQNNSIDNLCLFRSQSAHLRMHWFARRHNLSIQELKFDQSWLIK